MTDARSRKRLQALTRELEAVVLRDLGGRLEAMFAHADDWLFRHAEGVDDPDRQRLYFDTMRALRLDRGRIMEAFSRQLGAAFRADKDPDALAGMALQADELQLADSRELEENIALSDLVSRATYRQSAGLDVLRRRFGWLAEQGVTGASADALAPRAVAFAFQEALRPQELERDLRLVVYRLFDRELLAGLGELHAQIDRRLQAAGVLADVPAAPGAGVDARDAARARRGEDREPGIPEWDRAAFVAILREVQGSTQAVAVTGLPSAQRATAELLQRLALLQGATERPRRAREEHVRIVHSVNTLFSRLYLDPDLPGVACEAIALVQIPVMCAALEEPVLLEDPAHPVRRLLQAMVEQGRELDNPGASVRLWDVAERVAEAEDVVATSARALAELQGEAGADEPGIQGQEAARERARRYVINEMRGRLRGRVVPEEARSFLLQGWGPRLMEIVRRAGPVSEDWQRAIDLLERLVDCLQPESGPAGCGGELHAALRMGLERAGFSPERINALAGPLEDRLAAQPARYSGPAGPAGGVRVPEPDEALRVPPRERRRGIIDPEPIEIRFPEPPAPAREPEPVKGPAAGQDDGEVSAAPAEARHHPGQDVAGSRADGDAPVAGRAGPPLSADQWDFLEAVFRRGEWFEVHMGEGRAVRRLKALGLDRGRARAIFADRTMVAVLEKEAAGFLRDLLAGRSRPIYADGEYRRRLEALPADRGESGEEG